MENHGVGAPIQMEDTPSTGTKRPLEDDDKMVKFVEILTAEAKDVDDDEH